ncbi:hypothetical protein [Streptomyces sp. NPDC048659]|uniref:hypothetical protein n=1 Tax=Streptomyces sp. NPDC048659 TaxID=3155489 RepID=UPI0034366FC0
MDQSDLTAPWGLLSQTAAALMREHDRDAEAQSDRYRRFDGWRIPQATGDGVIRVLLALALRSLMHDAAPARAGGWTTTLAEVELTALAARVDHEAKHELLAGLRAETLGDQDQPLVDLLTLLIRSATGRDELYLERVSRTAQHTLETLQKQGLSMETVVSRDK